MRGTGRVQRQLRTLTNVLHLAKRVLTSRHDHGLKALAGPTFGPG